MSADHRSARKSNLASCRYRAEVTRLVLCCISRTNYILHCLSCVCQIVCLQASLFRLIKSVRSSNCRKAGKLMNHGQAQVLYTGQLCRPRDPVLCFAIQCHAHIIFHCPSNHSASFPKAEIRFPVNPCEIFAFVCRCIRVYFQIQKNYSIEQKTAFSSFGP